MCRIRLEQGLVRKGTKNERRIKVGGGRVEEGPKKDLRGEINI